MLGVTLRTFGKSSSRVGRGSLGKKPVGDGWLAGAYLYAPCSHALLDNPSASGPPIAEE